DADGTQDGYELNLTSLISSQVDIHVIASGGAGKLEHISDVFTTGKADAALVASIVHYGTYQVSDIKFYLDSKNVKVRKNW
ncbi:MAG: imidazole glycerol phosphate synthase subunit HisF, partial [Deltaproteobacteria bacterium]|nr:imidazole glycerol phosphate synthase subunit HisF [Deltaproteobacteria bacterium]